MLTKKQLSSLTINAVAVKMLITFPRSIYAVCANSAWISMVCAVAVVFTVFFFTMRLYRQKHNVIGLAYKTGGVPLRMITGISVYAVLGLNFAVVLRTFPEVIRLVLLQKTYVEIITAVFVICIIFGAYCGIEAVARVQRLFLPVAGVVFGIFLIMLIPDMHFGYILPIFGKGTKSILLDSASVMSVFTDLLILNILISDAENTDCVKKAGYKAVFWGGGIAAVIFLVYAMCYSYPASAEFTVPVYQLERLVNLGEFFSRLEAVFQFIWAISVLLYGVLYAAVLAKVWSETFCVHHTKPLIAPSVIALAGVSLIPESLNDMICFETFVSHWIYFPALLIPILIGVTYYMKMFHVKQNPIIY